MAVWTSNTNNTSSTTDEEASPAQLDNWHIVQVHLEDSAPQTKTL